MLSTLYSAVLFGFPFSWHVQWGSRRTQKRYCNIPHHLPWQKVRTTAPVVSCRPLPALVHGASVNLDGGDAVGGGDGAGVGRRRCHEQTKMSSSVHKSQRWIHWEFRIKCPVYEKRVSGTSFPPVERNCKHLWLSKRMGIGEAKNLPLHPIQVLGVGIEESLTTRENPAAPWHVGGLNSGTV